MFRQRRRMELRFLARFPRTLRKYVATGVCVEADRWTAHEVQVAESLLEVLLVRARRLLEAARLERGNVRQTKGTWPWLPSCPDIPGEVAAAVTFVCEDGVSTEVARRVAERLQSDLHLRVLKEALSFLIPGALGFALGEQQKGALRGDAGRVGAKISAKGWGVDVSTGAVLLARRPMSPSVLEFFLVVLRHVYCVLGLRAYVASHKFGDRVGGCIPVGRARAPIQGWKQFDGGQTRVKEAEEFFVPTCYGPECAGVRCDWVFARIVFSTAGMALSLSESLRVFVADRQRRAVVAKRVAELLCQVLPLPGYFLLSWAHAHKTELVARPDCGNRQGALIYALGLLAFRVAELAGVSCMPVVAGTSVHDILVACCEAGRWTAHEVQLAESLLGVLRARARRELEVARLERGKARQTDDIWPWFPSCPGIPGGVAVAVTFVCEDFVSTEVARRVAERLQSDLHLPVLKEALSCLMPGALRYTPGGQQKKCRWGDAGRVGVKISAKGLCVDASTKAVFGGRARYVAVGILPSSVASRFLPTRASGLRCVAKVW